MRLARCQLVRCQKLTNLIVNTQLMKCVVEMNGWCYGQHSVVIHFQLSRKHVGVHHGVCIEECDGTEIANGVWLVVDGAVWHLWLLP